MAKKKFEEYDDSQESKFNMALASLKRLHDDFVICKLCSMRPELWDEWYKNLRNCYREIHCVLTKEEIKECENMINDVKKRRQNHAMSMGMKHIYSDSFYEKLDKFEIYLRQVANKHDLIYPNQKSILDFAEKLR